MLWAVRLSGLPERSLQWVWTNRLGGSNRTISPLSSYGSPRYWPLWTKGLPTFQSVSVSTPKNHCLIRSGVVNALQTSSMGASIVAE